MQQLQRLFSAYLDIAEDMALRQIPMTMEDCENELNKFIAATDREILQDARKVTAEIAKAHVECEKEIIEIEQEINASRKYSSNPSCTFFFSIISELAKYTEGHKKRNFIKTDKIPTFVPQAG